jgi:hypothetical protein
MRNTKEVRVVVFTSLGCSTMITMIYFASSMKAIPFSLGLPLSFLASLYLGVLIKKIPTTVVASILTTFLTLGFLSVCLSLPAVFGYITVAPDIFVFSNIAWIIRLLPLIIASVFSAGLIGCILTEFLF